MPGRRKKLRKLSARRARAKAAKPAREAEKCFYVGVVSFAVVLTALLAHGAAFYSFDTSGFPRRPDSMHRIQSRNAIYRQAMALGAKISVAEYSSRLDSSRPRKRPLMVVISWLA